MTFQNRVENIQTAGYNGTSTVFLSKETPKYISHFTFFSKLKQTQKLYFFGQSVGSTSSDSHISQDMMQGLYTKVQGQNLEL